MPERKKALILLLSLVLPIGAGCSDPGVDAVNRARAALQDGKVREAEALAEEASDLGRIEGGFLRGNVAFAECLLAERQADAPAAEPFAFDVAIAYAQRALRFWRHAAMTRGDDDWPEARRNAERALLKIEALQKKRKARADRRRSTDPKPKPKPRPKPGKTKPDKDRDPEATVKPQLNELSPEEVRQLMEKLTQKQREKLELRRTQRTKTAPVARDW